MQAYGVAEGDFAVRERTWCSTGGGVIPQPRGFARAVYAWQQAAHAPDEVIPGVKALHGDGGALGLARFVV